MSKIVSAMCGESRIVPDATSAARPVRLSFIALSQVIRIWPEELSVGPERQRRNRS
jgi:hypothetical protein